MTSLINNSSKILVRGAWFYVFENLFDLVKDSWSLLSAVLEKVYKEIPGSRGCRYWLEKGRPWRPSQCLRNPEMSWNHTLRIIGLAPGVFTNYMYMHYLLWFLDHHVKSGNLFIKRRKLRCKEGRWLSQSRELQSSIQKSSLWLRNFLHLLAPSFLTYQCPMPGPTWLYAFQLPISYTRVWYMAPGSGDHLWNQGSHWGVNADPSRISLLACEGASFCGLFNNGSSDHT